MHTKVKKEKRRLERLIVKRDKALDNNDVENHSKYSQQIATQFNRLEETRKQYELKH